MRELAVCGAQAIGADGCSRVDFLKDTDGSCIFWKSIPCPV